MDNTEEGFDAYAHTKELQALAEHPGWRVLAKIIERRGTMLVNEMLSRSAGNPEEAMLDLRAKVLLQAYQEVMSLPATIIHEAKARRAEMKETPNAP